MHVYRVFYQIEDCLVYCRTEGLAQKTIQSYEQSLRLFARYCEDEHQVDKAEKVTKKMIVDYLTYVRDRGKYTVVTDDLSRKSNNPHKRTDLGKRVSVTTVNNYLRNIKAFYTYCMDFQIVKKNPTDTLKAMPNKKKQETS